MKAFWLNGLLLSGFLEKMVPYSKVFWPNDFPLKGFLIKCLTAHRLFKQNLFDQLTDQSKRFSTKWNYKPLLYGFYTFLIGLMYAMTWSSLACFHVNKNDHYEVLQFVFSHDLIAIHRLEKLKILYRKFRKWKSDMWFFLQNF